jgi:hypothetical protein
MRVVCPYTRLEPATRVALGYEAVDAEFIALRPADCSNETHVQGDCDDYFRLLTQLWAGGQGFVVVEHDIVPWPGSIRGLLECDQPLCLHRYQIAGGMGYGLGCSKFSAQLTRDYWDLPQVLERERGGSWSGRWCHLDGEFVARLRDRMQVPLHFHEPAVTHLHDYEGFLGR